GSSSSGSRQIGTAWYDHSRNDWLRRLGAVKGSVVHHALKGPDLPEELLGDLAEEASARWSEPWVSAALHGIDSRTIVGIPIKEYVPDNLVNGRRSEEHTSELQSRFDLVCRLLLEKKNR